jgi:hypothetical protein
LIDVLGGSVGWAAAYLKQEGRKFVPPGRTQDAIKALPESEYAPSR